MPLGAIERYIPQGVLNWRDDMTDLECSLKHILDAVDLVVDVLPDDTPGLSQTVSCQLDEIRGAVYRIREQAGR